MNSLARSAVREGAGRILRLAPTRLWRALFPKAGVGVCYHLISDTPVAHLKHYPILGAAQFETDLDYLQSQYGFIAYQELSERRAATHPVRDNAAILTFDDGFSQCADVAAPILKRRGIPAVFFVITSLIDNRVMFRETEAALCIDRLLKLPVHEVEAIAAELDLASPPAAGRDPVEIAGLCHADRSLWPLLRRLLTLGPDDAALLHGLSARLGVDPAGYLQTVQPYLTTDQIRRLHADGFVIGAHSRDHRALQTLTPEDAEREIVESCRAIAAITGQASVPFAFPYFGGGLDRAWLEGVRSRNPVVGLYFDTDGVNEDAPFVVQRVFGERFGRESSLDAILRRAWARSTAWRRRT